MVTKEQVERLIDMLLIADNHIYVGSSPKNATDYIRMETVAATIEAWLREIEEE